MKKEEFLINSVNDIQETIRSLDNKFFGIFVLLILPLTEDIFLKSFSLQSCKDILFVILWIMSLLFTLLGIYPKEFKIELDENKIKSSYFRSILNTRKLSSKELEKTVKKLEKIETKKELIFEQYILAKIRNRKLKFFKYTFILIIASILIFISKYF
jgi:hypothetical protein